MKIYFLVPKLTLDDYKDADRFFRASIEEVREYVLDVFEINSNKMMSQVETNLDSDSIVILFNNSTNIYEPKILSLLGKAKEKEALIWPVAFNKDQRIPMQEISDKQSFDVYEQLRIRNLKEGYLEVIGRVFARKIISRCLPTIYNEKGLIFVSHRRVDGEEIAAKLCDQIEMQNKCMAFRDVVEVEVGEPAQDIIDTALSKSDVMIFIHTNKSAESEWIKKELVYAVLHNIPIIWVNIDDADINKLVIKPTDKPHLKCLSSDFEDSDKLVGIVDELMDIIFKLSMLSEEVIYDQINTFEEFCEKNDIELCNEDQNNLIFCYSSKRRGYVYPQRNIKHYVQYFGRRCDDHDIKWMEQFLENKKIANEKLYDSAIILSDRFKLRKVSEVVVEENFEDFNLALEKYHKCHEMMRNDEIILSGAFTEVDEVYKQALKDAVNIFAKEILKNGFKLTFGAHPTFQNIIFEIGKLYRSNDYKNAINMYISKFFKYDINNLNENATIFECERISEDINVNLTEMRTQMINNRKSIKALICLGGVIRDGDTTKGIDQEIQIARENNIPVFVIGSVGGRSSQIAIECVESGNWKYLNDESNEFNEELTFSLDYRYLSNKILDIIDK